MSQIYSVWDIEYFKSKSQIFPHDGQWVGYFECIDEDDLMKHLEIVGYDISRLAWQTIVPMLCGRCDMIKRFGNRTEAHARRLYEISKTLPCECEPIDKTISLGGIVGNSSYGHCIKIAT